MVWVELVATSKLLGCPHSPYQREFCTEGWYARENTENKGVILSRDVFPSRFVV